MLQFSSHGEGVKPALKPATMEGIKQDTVCDSEGHRGVGNRGQDSSTEQISCSQEHGLKRMFKISNMY